MVGKQGCGCIVGGKVKVGRGGDRMAGCVPLPLVLEARAIGSSTYTFPCTIECISALKGFWVRWGSWTDVSLPESHSLFIPEHAESEPLQRINIHLPLNICA